jgi:hypothetical protein
MGPWQPLNGEIYRQTEKMMYLPLIRYKKLRTIDGTLHTNNHERSFFSGDQRYYKENLHLVLNFMACS